MKFISCIVALFACVGAQAASSSKDSTVITGADTVVNDVIFWRDLGDVLGKVFVGAMSSTQKNMYDTTQGCFKASQTVAKDIKFITENIFIDFVKVLNELQVASIHFMTTIETCNLKILIEGIDSRMSNLDYILGILVNVTAQIGAGFQTQNWLEKSNTNESIVYLVFNQMYPEYVIKNWTQVGRLFGSLIVKLLNFQSPSVKGDLGTF